MHNSPPPGFIDIHCHLLPGIDDGPATVGESLEMLMMEKDDGVTHVFATPHVMFGSWDNTTATIGEAFRSLRAVAPKGIEVLMGADVRVVPDLPDRMASGEIPTLGGSPYLLMELPSYALPPNMEHLVHQLRQRGFTPIITHPERCVYFVEKPSALAGLLKSGALCQVTAASVTGGFGRHAKRFVIDLIEKDLVDFVATDSHGVTKRPPALSRAYREIVRQFDRGTADRIFIENPLIILDSIVMQ